MNEQEYRDQLVAYMKEIQRLANRVTDKDDNNTIVFAIGCIYGTCARTHTLTYTDVEPAT